MYVDSVNDVRAACLYANLCKALHLLSRCSFEDIIASWFHISIAHYAVPYHFILKIKQNRIFKINDVRHISLSLPLGRISKWLEHKPFFLLEASGLHYGEKSH